MTIIQQKEGWKDQFNGCFPSVSSFLYLLFSLFVLVFYIYFLTLNFSNKRGGKQTFVGFLMSLVKRDRKHPHTNAHVHIELCLFVLIMGHGGGI